MTALSVSQIPSGVNTVEKLIVWGLLLAKANNPRDQLSLEATDGSSVRVSAIQTSHFDDAAGQRRFYGQIYMPMDRAYDSDRSRKLWTFANEIGTVLIPAGFSAD